MFLDEIDNLAEKAKALGCKVIREPELKRYTTFRIGGKAPLLIELENEKVCAELISEARCNNIPYYILGKGSNLIIDDEYVNAVFFHISGGEISLGNDGVIKCFAGAALSALCSFALEHSLTGLEFAYGIPGTVGGAVYMNAGAYGGEIKDVIVSATVLTADGDIKEVSAEEMELSYRHSAFQQNGSTVLSASFKLAKGDYDSIKEKMNELMDKRRSKQPLEYASAGSTFKRPEGSFASLLIDQCGLKGMSVGDAEVSTKHSGFIVNKGNASFDELMELIGKVRAEVFAKTGYELECEPIIISDREEYRK